jgi:undecaprenyl-diphosphatase
VERLGSTPSTSSFPSGHSAAGVALWVAIALLVTWPASRRRWRTPAIVVGAAIAVAIGLSRLYRGMHFATDVLAGWILGTAALLAALLVVEAAIRGTNLVSERRWIVQEPHETDPSAARSRAR